MSKFSVICEWTLSEDDLGGSMYGFARRETKGGRLLGEWHFMLIRYSRTESINTLVHEINECETFNLLRTQFKKEIPDVHKIYIKVNKKMVKKYPWIFSSKCPELEITHLISPFGQKNCVFPRRSYHLSWGKMKKV